MTSPKPATAVNLEALKRGCAETYGLRVTCGGDLEMRTRGRLTGRRAQKAKSR